MKCKNCNGKGYGTSWRGEQGFADFHNDQEYKTPCKEEKIDCRQCGGAGKVPSYNKIVFISWLLGACSFKFLINHLFKK